MARSVLAVVGLALALAPIAAYAQTAAPPALPPTSVMRAPMTFSAASYLPRAPQSSVGRSQALALIRAQRSAQERAYVQKYGYGTAVKLRARRY